MPARRVHDIQVRLHDGRLNAGNIGFARKKVPLLLAPYIFEVPLAGNRKGPSVQRVAVAAEKRTDGGVAVSAAKELMRRLSAKLELGTEFGEADDVGVHGGDLPPYRGCVLRFRGGLLPAPAMGERADVPCGIHERPGLREGAR